MQQLHHFPTFTLPVAGQAACSPGQSNSSSFHLFHFELLSLNFKQRARWGPIAALCNSINTFSISTSSFPLQAIFALFSRHITLTADRHSLTLAGTHVLSHLSDFQLMSSQFIADIHVIDPAVCYLAFWITSQSCANVCLLLFLCCLQGRGEAGLCSGCCTFEEQKRQEEFICVEKRAGREELGGSAEECFFPLKKY